MNILINNHFSLVFTCKNDKDCYGNGYCKARICECLANYEYAQDCSHYGCKYILETFMFYSTFKYHLRVVLDRA